MRTPDRRCSGITPPGKPNPHRRHTIAHPRPPLPRHKRHSGTITHTDGTQSCTPDLGTRQTNTRDASRHPTDTAQSTESVLTKHPAAKQRLERLQQPARLFHSQGPQQACRIHGSLMRLPPGYLRYLRFHLQPGLPLAEDDTTRHGFRYAPHDDPGERTPRCPTPRRPMPRWRS